MQPPLPVDTTVAFFDAKGRTRPAYAREMNKRLAKVAPLVARVLEPGEMVLYVVAGVSPFGFMEFLTTGWIVTVVRRCWLVVTDRRLLQLPARGNLKPRGSIAEVRFGDVAELRVRSFFGRQLIVRYRDGARESFTIHQLRAAAKLAALLPALARKGTPTPAGRRRFLCPRCAAAPPRGAEACPSCRLALRTRSAAIRWSLLLPGGGYFYTSHPFLGAVDFAVEGGLLALGLYTAWLWHGGLQPAGIGFFMVLAALTVEKLVTIYHAVHYVAELLPERAAEVAQGGRMVA